MEVTDRIVVNIVTLDWLYGWYGNFDILVSAGSQLNVDWGDGKLEHCEFEKRVWVRLSHEKKKKRYGGGISYKISICVEKGQILGFSEALVEFQLTGIDISGCPSLQMLNVRRLNGLDMGCNPDLRVLVCEYMEVESIDLTHNRLLESLSCMFSNKLKALDLSKCDALQYLNCCHCGALSRIKLSNHSALTEVYIGGTDLMKKSKFYLCKIVEQNGGTVGDEDSFSLTYLFPFGAAALPLKKN